MNFSSRYLPHPSSRPPTSPRPRLSFQLCKIIDLELVDNQVQELDMVRLVARCTFDVIGVAGELPSIVVVVSGSCN